MSEPYILLLNPDYQKVSDPPVVSVRGSLFNEDKGRTQQQGIFSPLNAVNYSRNINLYGENIEYMVFSNF
jgi:hypothetical protein